MFLTKARRHEGSRVLSLIDVLIDLFVPLSLRERFCSKRYSPPRRVGSSAGAGSILAIGNRRFWQGSRLHDCSFLQFIKAQSTRLLRKVSGLRISQGRLKRCWLVLSGRSLCRTRIWANSKFRPSSSQFRVAYSQDEVINGSSPDSRSMALNRMSGRPIRAVGSSPSIASSRVIPSPSDLKLPAQLSGCSRST